MPVPNNILIPEHKIAVFCITKAANTSIKMSFLEALGLPADNPHGLGVFQYASKEGIDSLDGWFSFAFVRNPYDRVVSLWADKCREKVHPLFAHRGMNGYKEFGDFVKALCRRKDFDIHWVSYAETLMIKGYLVPEYLFKYENLINDWKVVQLMCEKRDLIVPALPFINKSIHNPWEDYYTPELKALIYARYEKDFEMFYD